MTTDLTALATRLHRLADLLDTAGHLAQQRAHEHAPGIRATSYDPGRSHGGDPTQTAALANLAHPDPHADLERDLNRAINTIDQDSRTLAELIPRAIEVHRRDTRPTVECGEALCTEAATPGRLGYCETDYRRRLRWAQQNHGTTAPDWDTEAKETPRPITKAERLGIHQAPPLTHEQLAERAIKRRRKAG